MSTRRHRWEGRVGDGVVAIADFDLAAEAVAPSLGGGGAAHADVCVRLHGVPLGVLRLTMDECAPDTIRRLATERFAARAHRLVARWNVGTDHWRSREPALDALRARAADAVAPEPDADTSQVTVVICTRDRPRELARALASLAAAGGDAQLLVVDNSRDHNAAPVCERFPVRLVHEPRPGLDIARNRGVAESRTSIVAFR